MKHDWKPGTMIYPLPAVMVSCVTFEYNIIIRKVGTICTNPAMCYIYLYVGTILLSDLEEEYGIRHQLDES